MCNANNGYQCYANKNNNNNNRQPINNDNDNKANANNDNNGRRNDVRARGLVKHAGNDREKPVALRVQTGMEATTRWHGCKHSNWPKH